MCNRIVFSLLFIFLISCGKKSDKINVDQYLGEFNITSHGRGDAFYGSNGVIAGYNHLDTVVCEGVIALNEQIRNKDTTANIYIEYSVNDGELKRTLFDLNSNGQLYYNGNGIGRFFDSSYFVFNINSDDFVTEGMEDKIDYCIVEGRRK